MTEALLLENVSALDSTLFPRNCFKFAPSQGRSGGKIGEYLYESKPMFGELN